MLDQQGMIALLKAARTIAVVGLSPKTDRASHRVAAYMQSQGYKIIPVRPGGQEILGEQSYPSLADIPADVKIDIVDVFRRSEDTPPVAQAAVKIGAGALWLQSGISHPDSRAAAEGAGMTYVENLCLMVEHRNVAGLF